MKIIASFLFRISTFVLKKFVFNDVELKVNGSENLPKKPLIIIANHDHPWDPCLITHFIYRGDGRIVHFFTGKSLFKGVVLLFLKGIQQIPVQSGLKGVNKAAFIKAKKYLKQGDIVGIFPYPFDVIKNKRVLYGGVVRLLQENDVMYVPIKIRIKEKRKWRSYYDKNFDKANIYIGKPMRNYLYKKEVNEKKRLEIAKKLIDEVYNLPKC